VGWRRPQTPRLTSKDLRQLAPGWAALMAFAVVPGRTPHRRHTLARLGGMQANPLSGR